MSQFDSVAVAWEDVSFWQELAEHLKLPEPGIVKAREHAWKRYERALQLSQKTKTPTSVSYLTDYRPSFIAQKMTP